MSRTAGLCSGIYGVCRRNGREGWCCDVGTLCVIVSVDVCVRVYVYCVRVRVSVCERGFTCVRAYHCVCFKSLL